MSQKRSQSLPRGIPEPSCMYADLMLRCSRKIAGACSYRRVNPVSEINVDEMICLGSWKSVLRGELPM